MHVIVTGSASGIGAATRHLLEETGHKVTGVDLRNAEITGDLGTPDGRQAIIEKAESLCGTDLAAVIACAGVADPPEATMSVNYFGTTAVVSGLRPILARNGPAAVAIVTSSALALAEPDHPAVATCLAGDEKRARELVSDLDPNAAYALSKLALSQWIRHTAVSPEWVGQGVTLNAVAPGLVATPLNAGLMSDPAMLEWALQVVPMPMGIGKPRQIAPALAFLVQPQAQFITGQTIFVDGGSDAVKRPNHV